MYKIGEFWADGSGDYTHCYKIIPKRIAESPRHMTHSSWDIVYDTLGNLGYKFHDAGNNHEKVVVSLDKPLSPEHLKKLEAAFSIEADDGRELRFV